MATTATTTGSLSTQAPRTAGREGLAAVADAARCSPTEADYWQTVGDQPVTGVTRIRYEVDAQGRVLKTEVVQSAGRSRSHRALDRLADRTLRLCREITPGTDDQGRPAGGVLEVEWTIR